ncbi:MAG TPA: hypothetical protein DEB60_03140 [Brevundimonas sp.]|nr:hypothetical protein [Brevundimonas sp.]
MTKSSNESDARAALRVVSSPEAEVYDLMRAPETTAERVKRLQAEARALAIEQVEALEAALCKAADMAREIADGGDAYPVGARELAAIHESGAEGTLERADEDGEPVEEEVEVGDAGRSASVLDRKEP